MLEINVQEKDEGIEMKDIVFDQDSILVSHQIFINLFYSIQKNGPYDWEIGINNFKIFQTDGLFFIFIDSIPICEKIYTEQLLNGWGFL